jgi:hypothetical protein
MTHIVAVVGSRLQPQPAPPAALQQPDHEPREYANGSPRRRQHGKHGAPTAHPTRSRTIDNATVGSRHGVPPRGSASPEAKDRRPGGGRRPSGAPRSGAGRCLPTAPERSGRWPRHEEVATHRTPWRDTDPLFRQAEIDSAREWITLLVELMCNPCVANTAADYSALAPGSIDYRCGHTTGGESPLAASAMSARAVCTTTAAGSVHGKRPRPV